MLDHTDERSEAKRIERGRYGPRIDPQGITERSEVMLETLSRGFRNAKARLTGVTELTPDNIEDALKNAEPIP